MTISVEIGDEVVTNFFNCSGFDFVVARIHRSNHCQSGFLVVAHLKGDPSREIRGTVIDDVNYGIDSFWFKKKDVDK